MFAAVLQSTHEDKDYVHIVMELCNGGELFDHIVEAQHFSERKVHTGMLVYAVLYYVACSCTAIGQLAGSLLQQQQQS
jgi:calcium-dependent protein kinase